MKPRSLVRSLADATIFGAGGLFVVSGAAKLQDLGAFQRTLASHGLVPSGWSRAASIGVSAAEITCGAMALAFLPARNRLTQVSAGMIGVVLVAFGAYAVALDFHPPSKPVGCGCMFGGDRPADWGVVALRNAIGAIGVLSAATRGFGGDIVRPRVRGEMRTQP